jgi:CubicO group peptidase (beta-lactamase class C family)
MMRVITALFAIAACGSAPRRVAAQAQRPSGADPVGPHRAAVVAQVQPLVDGQVLSGVVVGLYDTGRLEIYGFGRGPGGAPPNGHTLFEIGSLTKVYTSLLFADAVQRREVSIDTPLSELLPPGVTAPTRDGAVITLKHLALHSSGLPRLPPTIAARGAGADPYAGYGEDALYGDLLRTQLESAPGTEVSDSSFGVGLLGFAIGRKLGPGYARALLARVLDPLGLHDTYLIVPATEQARRASGTDLDLAPIPPWKFDALAGAGALVSSAHDQLALIDAELDAASGSKRPLRGAMRFTQEPELENTESNEGLGWQIDGSGRYWQNGGTGGFHSFLCLDPKTRRGLVVLSATSVSVVDHVGDVLWKVLDGGAVPPPPILPTAEQLAVVAGHYELGNVRVAVEVAGNRAYLIGADRSKNRLVPFSDHEFWIQALQSIAVFERGEGGKIARMLFVVGGKQLAATKVD